MGRVWEKDRREISRAGGAQKEVEGGNKGKREKRDYSVSAGKNRTAIKGFR